jgi:hypothetical protein
MVWMLALLGCGDGSVDTATDLGPPPLPATLTDQVDPHRIKAHVDVLADDATGGRIPGSIGAQMARDYIMGEMAEIGLQPLGLNGGFTYTYPNEPDANFFMLDEAGAVVEHATTEGVDLVGAIPGTDPARSDEVVVVMAHYDHLGVDQDGDAFNGAFDNATAVGMNLEIARVLLENNAAMGRTIVFIFTDDEEFGLDGADQWIRDPTVLPENVVFGVSTDPIGRASLPDFAPITLIGLERSKGLSEVFAEAAKFVEGPIYQINRDIIPVFSSDQDPFWEQETPALWFTNLGFTFYHTVDDTADTIDYRIVLRDAQLLMYSLALIGNTADRYEYLGPQRVGSEHATAAREMFVDIKASSHLGVGDKEQADFYIEQLDIVIEADSEDAVENAEILYTGALFFLLFDLPAKYPGEIPPPWPEGW